MSLRENLFVSLLLYWTNYIFIFYIILYFIHFCSSANIFLFLFNTHIFKRSLKSYSLSPFTVRSHLSMVWLMVNTTRVANLCNFWSNSPVVDLNAHRPFIYFISVSPRHTLQGHLGAYHTAMRTHILYCPYRSSSHASC